MMWNIIKEYNIGKDRMCLCKCASCGYAEELKKNDVEKTTCKMCEEKNKDDNLKERQKRSAYDTHKKTIVDGVNVKALQKGGADRGIYKTGSGKYIARIRFKKKLYNLGSFTTKEEAYIVREKKRKELLKSIKTHATSQKVKMRTNTI